MPLSNVSWWYSFKDATSLMTDAFFSKHAIIIVISLLSTYWSNLSSYLLLDYDLPCKPQIDKEKRPQLILLLNNCHFILVLNSRMKSTIGYPQKQGQILIKLKENFSTCFCKRMLREEGNKRTRLSYEWNTRVFRIPNDTYQFTVSFKDSVKLRKSVKK